MIPNSAANMAYTILRTNGVPITVLISHDRYAASNEIIACTMTPIVYRVIVGSSDC